MRRGQQAIGRVGFGVRCEWRVLLSYSVLSFDMNAKHMLVVDVFLHMLNIVLVSTSSLEKGVAGGGVRACARECDGVRGV